MEPRDFDRLYAADPDPWQVASSWYERRKIDVVLASLRRPRYELAWDAGCGTGHLVAALASRVDRIVATDASGEAADLARCHTGDSRHITVERSTLPERPATLTGQPDLVLLSEVLYYLSPADRQATYDLVETVAHPDADLVLVHWGPWADDAEESGLHVFNEAGAVLNARGWGRVVTHLDAEFYLGVFSRDVPGEVGGRDDPATGAPDLLP